MLACHFGLDIEAIPHLNDQRRAARRYARPSCNSLFRREFGEPAEMPTTWCAVDDGFGAALRGQAMIR
jgi:hypothetical protein